MDRRWSYSYQNGYEVRCDCDGCTPESTTGWYILVPWLDGLPDRTIGPFQRIGPMMEGDDPTDIAERLIRAHNQYVDSKEKT